MENSLIAPRLRLTRHPPQMKPDNVNATPTASTPRNLPDLLGKFDEDEDSLPTPRLSSLAKLASERDSPTTPIPLLPPETPAARLRALLARVPNGTPPLSRSYRPPSPSDLESDYDPVEDSDTPSIARESLREIFSHALREPGDTPQKPRQRRNSIDASPGAEQAAQERARNRGKRRSVSDEEAEKLSHQLPARTSTAAAAFDALRGRLAQSSSVLMRVPPAPRIPASQAPDLAIPADVTADTSDKTPMNLKGFVTTPLLPPDATITSTRSLQLPSHIQSQSNLLDQDSEMHRMIGDVDSSDADSVSQRKFTFPGLRDQSERPVPITRPLSWSSHIKSHTVHNLPTSRRASTEYEPSSSRASSVLSNSELEERRREADQGHLHERERAWRPSSKVSILPSTPDRSWHSQPHASPLSQSAPDNSAYLRSRRTSTASLQSPDDGRSSRASSVSSKSEYRARMKEAEEEKNHERERLWNMPSKAKVRMPSNLNANSPSARTRTTSTPPKPDTQSSSIRTLYRQSSSASLSSSSRASSPAHSTTSVGHDSPAAEDAERIRERNWNSPHPKWKFNPYRRSMSPLLHSTATPRSPEGKSGSTSLAGVSKLDQLQDASSPKPSPQGMGNFTTDDLVAVAQVSSSGLSESHEHLHLHLLATPHSPPSEALSGNGLSIAPTKIPSFKSRSGWQFPPNKTPSSPPVAQDDTAVPMHRAPSPIRPLPPTSGSHIPIKSPVRATLDVGSQKKPGHRRSPTEFTEAVGRIPPRIRVELVDPTVSGGSDGLAKGKDNDATAGAEDLEDLVVTSTPNGSSAALIAEPPVQLPPSLATSFPAPDSPPPSPPPNGFLQTPPRKPQTSKLEFQTPSPPRNMPELPGPPSEPSDDDRTPVDVRSNGFGDLTAIQTPKPPGAWAPTPIPPRRDLIVRPSSTPPYLAASRSKTNDTPHAVSLTRAGSLPPLTPAPPGAWLSTPAGSVRRKSILKVRFDIDPGELSSDAPVPESISPLQPLPPLPERKTSRANHDKNDYSDTTVGREPPRVPAVRLVDAFGRETTMDDLPQPPPEEPVSSPSRRKPESLTPRSKSTIRFVDAMGREVEDTEHAESRAGNIINDVPPALSHNEALARVRATIKDLAVDLEEVDRSYDDLALDDNRLSALEDASRAARNARKRITDSLRYVQSAEEDLRKKFGSLREGMNKSTLRTIEREQSSTWGRLNAWTIGAFLIFQLTLLALMYRYSSVRARTMFLQTYYDGFNVDLYLHLTNPYTLRHSIFNTPQWSISNIPEAISRTGLVGAADELWGNVTSLAGDWQRYAWDLWGNPQSYSVEWDTRPPT